MAPLPKVTSIEAEDPYRVEAAPPNSSSRLDEAPDNQI